MREFFLVLSFLSAGMIGGGCMLFSKPDYTEPVCYDLGAADEKVKCAADVELGLFSDKSGNGTRMVSRSADGVKVSYDELNRFSASPALLVKRCLAVCFAPEKKLNRKKVIVSGELLRFEYLSGEKKVRMVIDYQLESGRNTMKLRQELEEKVTGPGAGAATGFEKCIVRSAAMLSGEIETFMKECGKEKK